MTGSTSGEATGADQGTSTIRSTAQVLLVGGAMFAFISYWRTAAIVFCDLGSTAYYIGGIVEASIGPAAPWYILLVLLFSYAVRSVYIESCTLFVRGGVYRVVREGLGRGPAKLAVSALLFDYVLTGPISGVALGHYLAGFLLELLPFLNARLHVSPASAQRVKEWGAVLVACTLSVYFYRANLVGRQGTSTKALWSMWVTVGLAVVLFAWAGYTLALQGSANPLRVLPELSKKVEYVTEERADRVTGQLREQWARDPETQQLVPAQSEGVPTPRLNALTGKQEDPLGFVGRHLPESWQSACRQPASWLSLAALVGLLVASAHSILAMSGEETLAQVYREVQAPKLVNFKKAAWVVFVIGLLFTGAISFLAVLLIPDEIRLKAYADNLVGGLTMYLVGPTWARLALHLAVVVVGGLLLAGAVNTSFVGSHGLLQRLAEDGVLLAWFKQPDAKFGTASRMLLLILVLQLVTIFLSQGKLLLLGEAYAFGVVWSFVFQTLSMLLLRYRDPRPREYRVPGNVRVRGREIPLGLWAIFLVLVLAAGVNLLTKELATLGGVTFSFVFFALFVVSDWVQQRQGPQTEPSQALQPEMSEHLSEAGLALTLPYRKLVAIRSPHNMQMLERALSEANPKTTHVLVMTAKKLASDTYAPEHLELDSEDRTILNAITAQAEKLGRALKPLLIPTNNPLFAIMQTAKSLHVHEIVVGGSHRDSVEEQFQALRTHWANLHGGELAPLTIRVINQERDLYLDLAGGNRIPPLGLSEARSVEELRSAGIGVDRLAMLHDGSRLAENCFRDVVTLLAEQVHLSLIPLPPPPIEGESLNELSSSQGLAKNIRRPVQIETLPTPSAEALLKLIEQGKFDLVIIPTHRPADPAQQVLLQALLEHAPCRLFVAHATPG